MTRDLKQDRLPETARKIWRAGVDAVLPERLMRRTIRLESAGQTLLIDHERIDLDRFDRIVVIGAGKASGSMAHSLESILGPRLLDTKQLTGLVNLPDDCVRPLQRIELQGSRPAGLNEPTETGVIATRRMLALVESLGPRDLCLCLISGGGSALLTLPPSEVPLEEKRLITEQLAANGANIEQLNTVRKQLSRVKGGRLARACRAGQLVSLILSDVLGNRLDLIASGPTVADSSSPQDALGLLEEFGLIGADVAPNAIAYLRRQTLQGKGETGSPPLPSSVSNHLIGDNALAVDGAGIIAETLGLSHAMTSSRQLEGSVETVADHLVRMAIRMRETPGPDCLISGGEPVVTLAPATIRGKGGRNQQLVLAALIRLWDDGARGIAIVSGGTDGEDGPTNAAGAFLDAQVITRAKQLALDPRDYLARNDAHTFFKQTNALIKTGPTGTNVCDLRVVVVDRPR